MRRIWGELRVSGGGGLGLRTVRIVVLFGWVVHVDHVV